MRRDHPEIARLLGEGPLQTIAGHGVLDDPRSIFIRITSGKSANICGVDVPLKELMQAPRQRSGR